MNRIMPMLAALALFGGVASAAEPAPPRAPIKPLGACFDPARTFNFEVLDNRQVVLIDQGPRYFRIDLTIACPDLNLGPGIAFQTRFNDHRVCGDVSETVSSARGGVTNVQCPILKVTPIDQQTYRALAGSAPKP